MRSALLTNTATAAAKLVSNPATTAAAGQAASSLQLNTDKIQEGRMLSKERGPSKPKKIDPTFENEGIDPEKEGAAAESSEGNGLIKRKKLNTVA
jgi:hypothetical protein